MCSRAIPTAGSYTQTIPPETPIPRVIHLHLSGKSTDEIVAEIKARLAEILTSYPSERWNDHLSRKIHVWGQEFLSIEDTAADKTEYNKKLLFKLKGLFDKVVENPLFPNIAMEDPILLRDWTYGDRWTYEMIAPLFESSPFDDEPLEGGVEHLFAKEVIELGRSVILPSAAMLATTSSYRESFSMFPESSRLFVFTRQFSKAKERQQGWDHAVDSGERSAVSVEEKALSEACIEEHQANTVATIETMARECNERIEQMQRQIEAYNKELEALIADANARVEEQRVRVEKLQEEVREQEARIQQLKDDIARKAAEIEAMKAEVEALRRRGGSSCSIM